MPNQFGGTENMWIGDYGPAYNPISVGSRDWTETGWSTCKAR